MSRTVCEQEELMQIQKDDMPFVSAIIVAAGNSTRMGKDKQFLELCGIPVIVHTLKAFEKAYTINEIIVVTREESIPSIETFVKEHDFTKVVSIVQGGAERQASVMAGILETSGDSNFYSIHDGARPLIMPNDIDAVNQKAFTHKCAAIGVKVKDTIKRVDSSSFIEATVDREFLYMVQTPQVFESSLYKKSLAKAKELGVSFTDDCGLLESIGEKVYMHFGSYENIKITTAEDIEIAQAILKRRGG